MKNKFIPVLLVFLCMGFGDAVGPFVALAKDRFALSNFEALFIAFIGFIMFGILSIPVGLFQDRRGKKTVLLMGLAIALVGLVIPVFGLSQYALFLLTVLLLGAGAAILQVAGNPIMRDVSAQGKYARNLSIGQFFKAVGSLSGSLIPFAAAKWFGMDWKILFPIYSAALLLTIVVTGLTRIKEEKPEGSKPATFASCFSLLNNKYVLIMALAIFIYVGAEVSISSGIPIYLNKQFGIDLTTWGLLGNAFFFISILTGRLLGSFVLNVITAKRFFIITAVVSIAGLIGMFAPDKTIAIICVFITGLGFANIFPLIFSITVDSMPERSNEISGLMVTAIVGGAFIPPLMGFVADKTSIMTGFVVPLICVFFIFCTSIFMFKRN